MPALELGFPKTLLLRRSWKERGAPEEGRSPELDPDLSRNSARCLRISSSEAAGGGLAAEENAGGGGGGSVGMRRGGDGGDLSRSLMSLK